MKGAVQNLKFKRQEKANVTLPEIFAKFDSSKNRVCFSFEKIDFHTQHRSSGGFIRTFW